MSLRTLLVLGAAVCAVMGTACGDGGAVDNDATRARVVEHGDSAFVLLTRGLVGELNAALAAGGAVGAIDFCASEAVELTANVASSLGAGWELKRVTLRARNPRNEPDALEVEVLERFHAAEVAGEDLPQHHVQRTPDGAYRYYRPLVVAPMCVECHGPRDALDPGVARILDERYPNDQATGYAPGDLRGLVRVTVPAAALRP